MDENKLTEIYRRELWTRDVAEDRFSIDRFVRCPSSDGTNVAIMRVRAVFHYGGQSGQADDGKLAVFYTHTKHSPQKTAGAGSPAPLYISLLCSRM